MYTPRYIEQTIIDAHKTFKVLYVGGPRQVGKTTPLLHLAKQFDVSYVTFDDLRVRALAQKDPDLFLDSYPAPLLIDEGQYVPELFTAIKLRVDQSNKNGRYWLTGSQQFASLRHVQESLAGRVAVLSMLGFSSAELARVPRTPLPFTLHARRSLRKKSDDVFNAIFRGSFPALWQKNPPPLELFYNSYIQTYLDRDLRDLFGVSKLSEFHTFIQLCAARTGQLLNCSELARDAGISVHAAREWISILESTGQLLLLQPFSNNISKRLIKSPKLYFLDTGLAAYLTQWKTRETLEAGAMAGAIFETFVIGEIYKSYLFRGARPLLFYLRDKQGHEVDLVLQDGQELTFFEIKHASRIDERDLGGLRYFAERYLSKKGSAVISLSRERYPLSRDIEVVPAHYIS